VKKRHSSEEGRAEKRNERIGRAGGMDLLFLERRCVAMGKSLWSRTRVMHIEREKCHVWI